jgi:DNA-binding transcriptional ArsR family regulator
MAKAAPSDEVVVEQAQRRAALSGYLAENPGEHAVAAIAAALDMRPNVVGKTLKDMADNGLVPQGRREDGINYYRDGADVAPVKIKRSWNRRPKPETSAKDVELVVGGTLIIVGRNADTGRIRITLEDLA